MAKLPRNATPPKALVHYAEGIDPAYVGIYACRIRSLYSPHVLDDIFLLWDGRRWCYCDSDHIFRRPVLGWVGPLRRKLSEDL